MKKKYLNTQKKDHNKNNNKGCKFTRVHIKTCNKFLTNNHKNGLLSRGNSGDVYHKEKDDKGKGWIAQRH